MTYPAARSHREEHRGERVERVHTKLLILRPTMGQGGADRVTLNLLQLIDRDHFDISLVLNKAKGELIDEIPEGIDVHELNAWNLWTAWLPLVRAIREINPDIVFSTSSGANIVAVMARSILGKRFRLVLSERNVLYHGRKTLKRRIVVQLKRMLYHKADCITSVSGGVKQDLVDMLGIAPQRIKVVYNPVVTDDLPELMQQEVDHPWFRDPIPIVLGVGRLVREKDFETLIKAFERVRRNRACRLVILGHGPLNRSLRRCVRRLGLESEVWFAGYDKNPFRYMARCSLFVLSSRDEGLPGVLIQAMACGAPVISTNCHAGPEEIITGGVDGLLVPVGDVDALAGQMEFCLDNEDACRRMAQKARKSVSRFSVEAVLPQYLDALINERGA